MDIERKDKNITPDWTDARERVTSVYNALVVLVGEMSDKVASAENVEVKKAGRLVRYIVDMIADDDPLLLGMALCETRYDYPDRHPVNVCILSVSLGHKIGLGKKQLAELGVVALLSDIGKHLVPPEVLNKDGIYDEDDWRAMKKHTIQGCKAVFGMGDADEQLMKAAIVSFEHHLQADLSGYPKVRHIPAQDFYTRIVAIAELYDALTAHRSYAQGYRSPDRAVRILLEKAGRELDSVLTRQFVSMMGAYPTGSFVQLDTGELCIVVQRHDVFFKRPRVLVLSDGQGRPVKPFIAALSKRDKNGRYLRSIKKTLDPNKYKIDYASFFYSKPSGFRDID
ncbi:MAG TPA: HD domain-containing phosphohydrolase [Dissulfurispiraceae bacterium]|nr:HD domain-containing phosphohydrolase [Dissulfurispiraceae bacterium]